ncbi:unnamed protein product [Sphagnum jensenii]|uniref:DNA-directed RNA polymerase n=1 Tax=Sphagnum jensenii TaxID=128206 RepID=A0ABP0VIZ1_9BRYO
MLNNEHLKRDYPYLNNVKYDPRLLGFYSGLSPFVGNVTAPRLDMVASHINQALGLHGSQSAMLFAGPEQQLGDHEYRTDRRTQDGMIIAVIPKYPRTSGRIKINENPSLTVIYIGETDKKIHHFVLNSYTALTDGFGYMNTPINQHLLQTGWPLPLYDDKGKEIKFATSPSHKAGLYCMGLNANVAYMTMEETIEDSVCISQSLADRMATDELHQEKIIIRANQHPLNTYGVEDEWKIFPDIGETVNADGVICSLRGPISEETFIPDLIPDLLASRQAMHDETYYGAAGSLVIDLDFNIARPDKLPSRQYAQVEKYTNAIVDYWKKIVAVYIEHRRKPLSEGFSNLVNTAIQRLSAAGHAVAIPGMRKRSRTKLVGKNNRPIEFMEIIITYIRKRPVNLGFKSTDRQGTKGVIGKIIPDADMPIDQHGFRADIVIDPRSIIARMNVGQLYEQAINRTSEFVRRKMKDRLDSGDYETARDILLEYYRDINPNFEVAVRETKNTDAKMRAHVADCVNTYISIHVPPGLDTISPSLIPYLKEKWGVEISPVTFTQRDMDGELIGTFTTKRPVCIGSKYIYLLCKMPHPSSPGVAKVSQYNSPMKTPTSDRIKYPIRQTPVRSGEDEGRMILMDAQDASEWVRLLSLQGNSPKGVDAVVDALLTSPHPTKIERIPLTNKELFTSNTIIGLFNHMMSTVGVEFSTKGPYPTSLRRNNFDASTL